MRGQSMQNNKQQIIHDDENLRHERLLKQWMQEEPQCPSGLLTEMCYQNKLLREQTQEYHTLMVKLQTEVSSLK